MAIELVSGALPKSSAGRAAAPVNTELVAAIVKALTESPTIEQDGESRPNALGPKTAFETVGKAGGEARRYVKAIKAALPEGSTLRANVYGASRNEKGEYVKPFHWRVYVPLSDGSTPAE